MRHLLSMAIITAMAKSVNVNVRKSQKEDLPSAILQP